MKEDKSIYLKVDGVDPVFKTHFSPCECTRMDGIKVWIGGEGHFFPCDHCSVCDPDEAREDGRRQVVTLMNELMNMTIADNNKLFGYGLAHNILNNFSYEEIVEKLDAWKKEKKTIRVRDEVCHQAMQVRFVVTKIFTPSDGDVLVNGLKKDGTAVKGLLLCNVEKTGVHVDDIDSYLEV